MSRNKAIVTLLLGESYKQFWERYVETGWRNYAARHDYDLIALTEPLVKDEQRTFHWQKLLVPSLGRLRRYQHLVWLDADIQINYHHAPCIVSSMRTDKVGGVDVGFFSYEEVEGKPLCQRYGQLAKARSNARFATGGAPVDALKNFDPSLDTIPAIYAADGFSDAPSQYLNGGVLVLQPEKHAGLLADIYLKYNQSSTHYENTCLSYDLIKKDQIEWIDPRFNMPWAYEIARNYPFLYQRYLNIGDRYDDLIRACVNTAYTNNWFLHFAGGFSLIKDSLKLVQHDIGSALDISITDF